MKQSRTFYLTKSQHEMEYELWLRKPVWDDAWDLWEHNAKLKRGYSWPIVDFCEHWWDRLFGQVAKLDGEKARQIKKIRITVEVLS